MVGDFVVYAQIEKLCIERKVNLTALTSGMGMSKGNISNWRKGGYPSAEVLMKLADYFDVSVDYLLGRTDVPEVNR